MPMSKNVNNDAKICLSNKMWKTLYVAWGANFIVSVLKDEQIGKILINLSFYFISCKQTNLQMIIVSYYHYPVISETKDYNPIHQKEILR